MFNLEEFIIGIARECHEANRAYCKLIGDDSQVPWEEAEQWQKDSAIKGVRYHLTTDNTTPADSHESWMKQKVEEGWVYGEVKDPIAKTHYCMVPYAELPEEQKRKDYIFWAIVQAHNSMHLQNLILGGKK
jgi:hypothetical protein